MTARATQHPQREPSASCDANPRQHPGKLIVFEGLDGSGKSTQLPLLVAGLRAAGHVVVATREPTDGPVGRRIRAAAVSEQPIEPELELAWFVEDRRTHVAQVIAPALAAGRVVVSDRYYLSTVAYQGARGLDPAAILACSEAEFPVPDVALLLTLDAAAGLARVGRRGGVREALFEQRERLERVAEIFASLERPYLARVDATGSQGEVHGRIRARVREHTGLLGPRTSTQ